MISKSRGRSSNIYRRLELLENDSDTQPVILYFSDGSTETLSNERLVYLLRAVFRPETLSPPDQRKLDAISRCVRSVEPGGSHMVDLTRAILLSPAEPPR